MKVVLSKQVKLAEDHGWTAILRRRRSRALCHIVPEVPWPELVDSGLLIHSGIAACTKSQWVQGWGVFQNNCIVGFQNFSALIETGLTVARSSSDQKGPLLWQSALSVSSRKTWCRTFLASFLALSVWQEETFTLTGFRTVLRNHRQAIACLQGSHAARKDELLHW